MLPQLRMPMLAPPVLHGLPIHDPFHKHPLVCALLQVMTAPPRFRQLGALAGGEWPRRDLLDPVPRYSCLESRCRAPGQRIKAANKRENLPSLLSAVPRGTWGLWYP